MSQRKIFLIAMACCHAAFGQVSVPFENLGSQVNSVYSEFRPTVSADGNILYFVVEGNPKNTQYKISNKAQDIWYSEKDANGNWSAAKQAPASLNNQKSNAVFWVSPDGNRLLIRGAYQAGKYVGRGVSMTQKTESGWSPAEKLKIKNYEKMSQDAYSGASMSSDGKILLLYFSEEKNSYVNDIYVSFLGDNNEWSEPMDLGSDINSDDYNEITPFLASDGITLYYSSDRPGGKGNQDIWMTKRMDESWRKWTAPVNVRSANTTKWDAYFTLDAGGEKAFIATQESSIGGTDIAIVNLEESERPKTVVLVYGRIFNAATKEPMGAGLNYDLIPGEKNVGNTVSNPGDGSYKIVLPYGKKYRLRASAENYFPMMDTVDFSSVDKYKELHRDVYLNPADEYVKKEEVRKSIDSVLAVAAAGAGGALKPGDIVSMSNILFDFNKAILKADAFTELDKAVRMMKANPNMEIELSAHTDNVGGFEYNVKLSDERASSAREYILSKGIDAKRIISKGYGEVKPVASNDTEEGRSSNRRVEFRVLKN